ncbi:prepilin-type N-terminal cleavage/methylation domain-containing protein [Candidatus Omnitrophota bacterium]
MSTTRAFTLVEVMVSVAILATGLVLVLQGMTFALNALQIAENNLQATQAAQNLMVEARIQAAEDWEEFKNGLEQDLEFDQLSCNWRLTLETFSLELEEQEANEDLNLLSANLAWSEGKRKGRIPLVSLIRGSASEE